MPGIGFSPDKMLQARVFSYADAHRYRLGTHYEAMPVNAPKCPVHHYHRTARCGSSRNDTGNPDAYYEPNSFGGPVEDKSAQEPPLRSLATPTATTTASAMTTISQPRALFNLFDEAQQARLFSNIAAAMGGVPRHIVDRQLAHFDKIHPDYGNGVRAAVAGRRPAIRPRRSR